MAPRAGMLGTLSPYLEGWKKRGERRDRDLAQFSVLKFLGVSLLIQHVPFRRALDNFARVGGKARSHELVNGLFQFHLVRNDAFYFLQRLDGIAAQLGVRRRFKRLRNHVGEMVPFIVGKKWTHKMKRAGEGRLQNQSALFDQSIFHHREHPIIIGAAALKLGVILF